MARTYKAEEMEILIRIAANIRTRRLELEIKSKDAAEYVGVKPTTYSNWEFALASIPPRAIYRLSNLLSCSIDYFYKNEVNVDEVFAGSRRDLGSGKKAPRRIIRGAYSPVADDTEPDDAKQSPVQVDDSVRSLAGGGIRVR